MSELVLSPHSTARVALHIAAAAGVARVTMPRMNHVERIGVGVYLHVAGQAVRTLTVGRLAWQNIGAVQSSGQVFTPAGEAWV
jgi:hypothetical protein